MNILAFIIGAIAFLLTLGVFAFVAYWLIITTKVFSVILILLVIVCVPILFYEACRDLGLDIIDYFKNRRRK